jgi:hypothetical protein
MPPTRTYEDALLDQMLRNYYLQPFEEEEKRLALKTVEKRIGTGTVTPIRRPTPSEKV